MPKISVSLLQSIINTSQLPIEGGYEIIGERTVADVIMDGPVYKSHRLELKGKSMRKKEVNNQCLMFRRLIMSETKKIFKFELNKIAL
jgi:hypothetical protein